MSAHEDVQEKDFMNPAKIEDTLKLVLDRMDRHHRRCVADGTTLPTA
jgi:hypothetical protein